MKSELGEHLIFIISSPRSGSTLLQHVLCSHSELGGVSEPFLMLHPLYALRDYGHNAEYIAHLGYTGLKALLGTLPEGEERYYIAVRQMALQLYNRFLEVYDKKKFVDKSNRYYLVVPELLKVFPKAKYIFLFRNPLAVLSSFLDVMVHGKWLYLARPWFRNDLVQCPYLMLEGVDLLGQDAIVVNYEDLVDAPQKTISSLCDRVGIQFEPEMINYGNKTPLAGLRDPKSIDKHQQPVSNYRDKWMNSFDTPQKLNLAEGYLQYLGPHLLSRMGYSYENLCETITSNKQRPRYVVVTWGILMKPKEERTIWENLRFSIYGWVSGLRWLGYRVKRYIGFPYKLARQILLRG